EAIFAAAGITEDHEQQAEIAAALMGMDFEPVLAEVKKAGRLAARSGATTRVIAGEQGARRAVVVERRVIRKRVATCFSKSRTSKKKGNSPIRRMALWSLAPVRPPCCGPSRTCGTGSANRRG